MLRAMHGFPQWICGVFPALRSAAGWAALLLMGTAQAGPPLISDDAQTLGGHGRAELIVAATGLRQAGFRQLDGPVVDVTAGLTTRLDATLVAAVSRLRDDGIRQNAALLCPGLKWQPIGNGRVNVSVSPALMLDLNDSDAAAALLPVQAELLAGAWTLGLDAGHIATRRGDEQWQAGSYVVWTPADAVSVLGEVWAVSARPDAPDRGATLGLDLGLPGGQRLLLGWGAGIDSGDRAEVDHYGYLGLMTAFGN